MAGFSKPHSSAPENNNNADGQELEQLEKELSDVSVEIRSMIGDTKDRNSLDLETRRRLSTKYVQAAGLSKELATRYIGNEQKQEEYTVLYKKLIKKAEEYGSSIQFEVPKTTLDDVKGLNEVKKVVQTFIYMARNPEILDAYKIEGGFGLFMYGAPGTGKTMFAKAVANALQLPLFVVEPSDIFKSYVGESEAAVKQLFEQINLCKSGAVVFIDECDELFSKRSSNSKDYKSAVTNQLLQNLNGFNTDGSKRILIAATNLPWMVDPAYLRYKRFSHHVHITPPDEEAMRSIIAGKLKNVPVGDVSVDDILFMLQQQCQAVVPTDGSAGREQGYYSSADVCGIIEEACRLAVEKLIQTSMENGTQRIPTGNYPPVTREMFEKAIRNKMPSINSKVLKRYDDFHVGQD